MILIGEMNLTLKKGTGDFYCPVCSEQRGYVHRRVKRFLTLYFIPVLPIATISDYVRCQICRQNFQLQAITKTKAEYDHLRRLEFAADVRRIMVLTMLADGQIHEAELDAITSTYRQLSGESMSRENLERDVEQARRAKVEATQYARAIALRRTEEEREGILRGAFLVASATGTMSPQRLDQIKGLPQSLGISEERFREIIAKMS